MNKSNGRVNLFEPTNSCFTHQDNISMRKCTDFRDAMIGNWYNTQLSDAFFSQQNINIIQNGIMAGVYKRSNGQYRIGQQSCDELKIIMRSFFLQYSKNVNNNITEQISSLNKLVLDYAINQVFNEATSYMQYKQDISTLAVPILHPVMSKTNDKQLILKHWF